MGLGKLKMKGEVVKKKKKKSKATPAEVEQVLPPTKTDSQLNFEAINNQRLNERVSKLAEKSHKERVNGFNTYLSLLSERINFVTIDHDIPRVGPG